MQRADAKKVLGSAHTMKMGGNAVMLGGGKSYTQNKKTGQETRVKREDGQGVTHQREGGGGARAGESCVQNLEPALRGRKSGVVRTREESAELGSSTGNRVGLRVRKACQSL